MMKYFVIILLTTVSCSGERTPRKVNTLKNDINHHLKSDGSKMNEKSFILNDSISYKETKLIVESIYLNDSSKIASDENSKKSPILKEQNILFYKKNELFKKYEIPVEKHTILLSDSSKLNVPEISAYKVTILNGTKSALFYISASGYTTSGPKEFQAFYTTESKIVYQGYIDDKTDLGFLKEYGITPENFQNSLKKALIIKDLSSEY